MKKVVLFALMATGLVGFAQSKEKKEVPKMVQEAFQKEYPNTKVSWDIEKDGYEAEFKLNGKDASVNYDKKGIKIDTEIAITENEVPKAAVEYVKKQYPKSKIKECAKITDAKNAVSYEIEIKMDKKESDVLFDSKGNFIKIVQGD